MKNILVLALFILTTLGGLAKEIDEKELKDVGIAKYGVVEAIFEYTPIRTAPDEYAHRAFHIKNGVIAYVDKEYKDFYRVDLGLKDYYWIEKKYAEIQAVIPNKLPQYIEKIKIKDKKDYYEISVPIYIHNTYKIAEVSGGLEFVLFDVKNTDLKGIIKKTPKNFEFKIENSQLKMKYNAKHLYGYDVITYDKGYKIKIRKLPEINYERPLKGLKIMVDAGHGGSDPGVCAFNHKESDVNLEVAKHLEKSLEKKGAKVYMVRKNDDFVDLYDRVNMARDKEVDIFISIHQNSLPDIKKVDEKHGVSTFYYHNQSKPLAQKIQDELLVQTGFMDDKVKRQSFAVIRPTTQVSVLVECGYLIHEYEMSKITDDEFQKQMSYAITRGVVNYILSLDK